MSEQLKERKRTGNGDLFKLVSGASEIEAVYEVDQSPIGKTSRSTPGTYVKVFDEIRNLYAQLPVSRVRGYSAGRFSFNAEGGRCETCKGDGQIKIEMHFLPDVYVPCEQCHGKRYNKETLDIRFKGKTIADVLEMSVEEALEFFARIPKIRRRLQTLHDVGLETAAAQGPQQGAVVPDEHLGSLFLGRRAAALDDGGDGGDPAQPLEAQDFFVDLHEINLGKDKICWTQIYADKKGVNNAFDLKTNNTKQCRAILLHPISRFHFKHLTLFPPSFRIA